MRKAFLALIAWSATAHAQQDRAAALFEEARTLSQQGKYAEACEKFEQSYALDPGAGTELNLGDCHEHLGQLAEAWRRYDEVAGRFETAHDSRAKYARERRDALGAKLGIVVVKVSDASTKVTIAGRIEPFGLEIRDHVDPGTVEVRAGEAVRRVRVESGATVVVDLAKPVVESQPPPPPPPVTEPVGHGRKLASYALWGAGGIALGTGITLGVVARGRYNAQLEGTPPPCSNGGGKLTCTQAGANSMNDAIHLANIGTVVGVGGLVLAAVGTVLFVTAPSDHAMVMPAATPTTVGLSISGSF